MSRYRRSVVKPVVPTTSLLAHFKRSGRLIIANHDGSMWVTDSILLVRLEDAAAMTTLLAAYNLPLEPMCCDVRQTIVRTGAQVPDVTSFVPAVGTLKALDRETLGGLPVLVDSGGPASVWRTAGGSLVTLNEDNRKMVESLTPGADWHSGEANYKPVVRVNGGQVAGVLMPLRSLFNENDKQAVA